MAHRPRPHVAIPPGAAPPSNPSPSAYDQPVSPINLWSDRRRPVYTPYTATPPASVYATHNNHRISLDVPDRPPSRASSAYEAETTYMPFPEPQLYRSSSQRSTQRPHNVHRSTRSDSLLSPDSLLTPTPTRFSYSGASSYSGDSRPPSIQDTPEWPASELASELSDLTVDSGEGLRKFQHGELPENDCEWHRLVPLSAREALDKSEVQRQSILFEIIKSEREYVADLELVKEVFIDSVVNTSAVPQGRLKAFIHEVFFNLEDVLVHHQRMLTALFTRQLEQFPLVSSLSDIILDNSLAFRSDYEEYIKHYPIAEMRHRSEMRRNQRYQLILQQSSQDPRVRKRDIITFLSRPVTRLPRLLLQLENVKKYTPADHPDMETIPLLLNILSDFIKSTQPGIEAAEEKVRFWSLSESLIYQKGEIIDLDLYDATRSLLRQGLLARKYKQEVNVHYHWADLNVALLDNYLLLLKPEVRQSELRSYTVTKHHVVSRPIPLEYLRLGGFDGPAENRREKAEDGSIFDRVRPKYRPMYPFTIYHAGAKMTRRYTLYAPSEAMREEWHDALTLALTVRQIRQEGNMIFAPQVINEGSFQRVADVPSYVPQLSSSHCTGPIASVAKFSTSTQSFIAVACPTGIHIAQRGEPAFHKVLTVMNPTCIVALPTVNKFLVLHDTTLVSYSLDMVARAALGVISPQSLQASRERIAKDVLFFRAGRINRRLVVLYGAKSYLQVYLYASEVVINTDMDPNPRRTPGGFSSFRSFGEPISISRDTNNITVLGKHVVICSDKGIIIADPANLSVSKPISIPDFGEADTGTNIPMIKLKERCVYARPLGIIRCDHDDDGIDELLVVYDEHGCYTTRFGVPTRSSGYVRWETKAASYAHRGKYLLLFSTEFIEIREVRSGKLVQVIEGEGMRRVDVGLLGPDRDAPTLFAVSGEQDKDGLVVDAIKELVETADLTAARAAEVPGMWDEFELM